MQGPLRFHKTIISCSITATKKPKKYFEKQLKNSLDFLRYIHCVTFTIPKVRESAQNESRSRRIHFNLIQNLSNYSGHAEPLESPAGAAHPVLHLKLLSDGIQMLYHSHVVCSKGEDYKVLPSHFHCLTLHLVL